MILTRLSGDGQVRRYWCSRSLRGTGDKAVEGPNAPFDHKGRDDDCDIWDGLCTAGTGPTGSDGGSTSEADWATARSGAVNVDLPGWTEEGGGQFTISYAP